MHSQNRFFLLPFQFDVEKLTRDLAVCEAQQWTAHFNQKDYAGDWNGIALRSATGEQEHILATSDVIYKNTPLLEACPYFQEIVARMECPVESVRLLALAPGSEIKKHRDQGLGYQHGCFRLHIPILTDDGVDFVVDDQKLDMEPGTFWYANFDLPHSVKHTGTTRRIHLIIDGKRNEWTDGLFQKAGYDFSLENQAPVYDTDTKNQMLEHLRLMDTDAARAIIAQLEQELKEKKTKVRRSTPEAPILSEWIPARIVPDSTPPVCQWLYFNEMPYIDPLFDGTLGKIRSIPVNRHPIAAYSSLDFLTAAATHFDTIPPTAFIFHVSRCGSTLLTQMLSTEPDTFIAVAEAPLLDEILRLSYRQPAVPQEVIDQAFTGAINALGRKRKGTEQHYIVKTDSWHLFFYETIRRLYPETPFILMYRLPHEVFHSHQKRSGIQAVPGKLEQEMIGFEIPSSGNLQTYLATLLGRYYEKMAHIAATDRNTHLLNYNQGITAMTNTLSAVLGVPFSENTMEKIMDRTKFHSKSRVETFDETAAPEVEVGLLRDAVNGYERLEGLRKQRK